MFDINGLYEFHLGIGSVKRKKTERKKDTHKCN